MIADFVLSLDGVTTFRPPDWSKDLHFPGTEAYFQRRAELNQDRVFFRAGCAATISCGRSESFTSCRQAGSCRKAGRGKHRHDARDA